TSQGLLRGEAVNSLIPFRFKTLSRKHRPVTPWAIITVQEYQHVFLTREGLFQTDGKLPTLWQPLFSEYLHDKVLPTFDLNNINTLHLFHDLARSWTVFSIAEDQSSGLFSKAFVLYNPTEKWGSYNQVHTGFVDVRRTAGADVQFSLGVVENDGSIYKFIGSTNDQLYPDETLDIFIYDYHELVEFPVRSENGVRKMPTAFRLRTQDESIFARSGIYDLRFVIQNNTDEDQTPLDVSPSLPGTPYEMKTAVKFFSGIRYTTHAFAVKRLQSLNAEILIGPFRAGEQETTDELSNILNLSLGMLDQGIEDTFEDWLLDYTGDVFEDWAAAPVPDEFEDWGIGATTGTLYDELVRGTIDGNSAWEANGVIMEQDPALIAQNGRQRHLSCDVTGLYNFVKISATQQGQSFALKTLDLNIQPAGVLY
ncbi:MAG: hypothetical protein KAJ10_16905, partial [Thermodesulfovibrionia bacterium]|nr:hypothetical protein [Thermodesulfovibrionia bacterium]